MRFCNRALLSASFLLTFLGFLLPLLGGPSTPGAEVDAPEELGLKEASCKGK